METEQKPDWLTDFALKKQGWRNEGKKRKRIAERDEEQLFKKAKDETVHCTVGFNLS